MSIPPVLRALLGAHGPSGYETAPAAVFRDAADAHAEVTTDVMGSVWARVPGTAGGPTLGGGGATGGTARRNGRGGARRAGAGRGPDAGRRRPHRRDRAHRHPYRRRR